jgi:shikimate kinase
LDGDLEMDNIILIGMPASGKSTVGVVLAKTMGYGFIDSDLVIQGTEKRKLSEIIDAEGIDGFIEVEDRVNQGIIADRCVISTGGSAIYGAKAMEHFKEIGTIVYLKVDLDEIKSRINGLHQRGVAIREGQTFDDLYEERCKLYEKYADVTIYENEFNVEKIISKITEAVNKNK